MKRAGSGPALILSALLWAPAAAQEQDPLLELLRRKGVLSAQESGEIARQRAQARRPAPPLSLAFGGYLQLRLSAQRGEAAASAAQDSFQVRRARAGADGTFTEGVDFHVLVEFNRAAALEHAEVRFTRFPQASLTLGQFKLPFSRENLASSKTLDFVERAQAVTALAPEKDIGAMLSGRFSSGRWAYRAAAVNGNGKNNASNDNGHFLSILRLEAEPLRRLPLAGRELTLSVGINGAYSRDSAARAETIFGLQKAMGLSSEGIRRLAGVDASLEAGEASLKAEYLRGEFKPSAAGARLLRTDGYSFQAGWQACPKLQVLARYEAFDPDKDTLNGADIRWTTLGLNYFLRGHNLKAQANYVFKRERASALRDDTLLAMLQLAL